MIQVIKRESPSGTWSVTYTGEKCELKLAGIEDVPVPGTIEHLKEMVFAPTGLVTKGKDGVWNMALNMPGYPVPEAEWPNFLKAMDDVMSFWAEVRLQL